MIRRAFCALASLIVICEAALALPRDRTPRQLHHTGWTARDGAPSQICCLAQTTDGYLWIGAAHGLYRFDGVQFERFGPRDVTLPSHNIYAMVATPDNGLWISFRPTGLGFLKDGKITVWTRSEDLPDIEIFTIASDRDGRLWAGTHRGPSAVRDEIYRIGREALVNAFRHGQAQNVEVEIEFLVKRLLLRIRDDGRGIDPAILQSGLDNHFGLAGMRERAETIGGELRVISRPGAGTEIELSVPLGGALHFWRAITISRRPNRRASTE